MKQLTMTAFDAEKKLALQHEDEQDVFLELEEW